MLEKVFPFFSLLLAVLSEDCWKSVQFAILFASASSKFHFNALRQSNGVKFKEEGKGGGGRGLSLSLSPAVDSGQKFSKITFIRMYFFFLSTSMNLNKCHRLLLLILLLFSVHSTHILHTNTHTHNTCTRIARIGTVTFSSFVESSHFYSFTVFDEKKKKHNNIIDVYVHSVSSRPRGYRRKC